METQKKHIKHVFPHKILDYVNTQYNKCNLVDIKEEQLTEGQVKYKLAVAEEANMHYLEFDENGNLIDQKTELKFKRPRHQDFFRDEGLYENN